MAEEMTRKILVEKLSLNTESIGEDIDSLDSRKWASFLRRQGIFIRMKLVELMNESKDISDIIETLRGIRGLESLLSIGGSKLPDSTTPKNGELLRIRVPRADVDVAPKTGETTILLKDRDVAACFQQLGLIQITLDLPIPKDQRKELIIENLDGIYERINSAWRAGKYDRIAYFFKILEALKIVELFDTNRIDFSLAQLIEALKRLG